MPAHDLADEAFLACPEIVVITGGEPAIHDLIGLAYQLRSRNLPVHIETCGAYPIMGEMDWITVSPKWAAPPIEENLERADEWKIIVEDEHSIAKWCEVLPLKNMDTPVWLHPEWSQSKNPMVLHSINEWVKENGFPFRAGFQLHKIFKSDQEDKRSKPEASLSHLPEDS
jgi:organic radical activating enzyme